MAVKDILMCNILQANNLFDGEATARSVTHDLVNKLLSTKDCEIGPYLYSVIFVLVNLFMVQVRMKMPAFRKLRGVVTVVVHRLKRVSS